MSSFKTKNMSQNIDISSFYSLYCKKYSVFIETHCSHCILHYETWLAIRQYKINKLKNKPFFIVSKLFYVQNKDCFIFLFEKLVLLFKHMRFNFRTKAPSSCFRL